MSPLCVELKTTKAATALSMESGLKGSVEASKAELKTTKAAAALYTKFLPSTKFG